MIIFDSDQEEWLYHTPNQLIPKREDIQFYVDRVMVQL